MSLEIEGIPARLRRHFLALLLVATALRLLVAAFAPLSPDEAYYWVWSRALAPGYLDHPPMVALWIRLGCLIAGQTPLGIRLLGPPSILAGSLLLRATGRDLGSDDAGLLAAVLLNASLLFGVGALTMTPDTPLLLFWTATLAALARLVATNQARWWLIAGLCCGLAMDSKYTAALLPLCALAWLLWSRQFHWLRHPAPWAGALLAALLFAPTLAWNAAHHWVSFAKQGGRTLDFTPAHAARYLTELLGGQAALVTPFLFLLCLAGLAVCARAAWRGHAAAPTLLAAFSLLPALVFVQHALGDRVQANWPAILWPAAALTAASAPQAWRRTLFRPGLALGLVLTALVYIQACLHPLPLPPRLNPLARIVGYRGLATRLAALPQSDGFLAIDEYGTASLIDFLAPSCRPVLAVAPRWRYFALPSGAGLLRNRSGLLLRTTRRHNPPSHEGWRAATKGVTVARRADGATLETYHLWHVTAGATPPEAAVLPCRSPHPPNPKS